jgi:hypothetical protein
VGAPHSLRRFPQGYSLLAHGVQTVPLSLN